ncbi:SPOR domain-containing protein [Methylobacterium sp. Leaf117]|uniref:SPOR domain-containing protein n=1 Tax=Methylobacterium sp. Leaf117 TaxID=1736260 RepID=UPI0006FF1AFE|nr:SPOR domain-containing protein [Methylobacterium sp. Leaf117]KQP80465.1 sporulation protein [Methylobacterium sp. Leaf117]
MTTNASRATVDFDAFARDLQQPQVSAQPQAAAQGQPPAQNQAAKPDPLAELARIVGQDDPFRALLQARDSRADAAAARGRIEPSFVERPVRPQTAPVQISQGHISQGHASEVRASQASSSQLHSSQPAYSVAAQASPTDAFDQYLASVDHGGYANPQGSYPDANAAEFAPNDADERVRPLERPRKRSRLVSVGAGLSVLALCVTGALAWRGLHGSSGNGGSVPTILADTAPLKIAPQKADGVEIPDQNKQIYERTAKDGQIRIVNREEQPLDVAQAARSALGSGEGGATPGSAAPTVQPPVQQGGLSDSLGEPRRVRTVSVKPDTPPPPPQREAAAETPAPQSVIPTMTLPGATSDGGAASPSLRQRATRLPPPVAEAPAATPSEPASAQAAAPAPAPRAKAPQRVAAVTPEATSAIAAPPPVAATAPVSGGGYTVQLGVRTSESEAQAAFRQMQGKYSQLSGQPALIRQAEVNGKTIYRVRVGPLGKTEATTLCTQLQGAGGQCFVAKN